MKVKFWDGTEEDVANRTEAIRVVKKRLNGWMKKGDRLGWNYSRLYNSKFPNIATVFTQYGEATDAGAIILQQYSF